MPFTTDLIVKECENGWWELVQPLAYSGRVDFFMVPKGFKTDFASVPAKLWSIVPPIGKYTKAAVLHDYFYKEQIVSRKDADGIFNRIMEEYGVDSVTRNLIYGAVRMFGGSHWHKEE